ncbi:MAG: DUF4249 domain-containing protein [Bacteroidota bacterium]
MRYKMLFETKKSWQAIVLIIIVAASVFPACEKNLELELQEGGGKLVLFSFLSPDSAFNVHLSKSVSHYSVDDFERVYDGYITVQKNGQFVDGFAFPIDQSWAVRPHLNLVPGDTVVIEGADNNEGNVSGQTVVPHPVKFSLVSTDSSGVQNSVNGNNGVFENTFLISDPAGENNYYQFIVFEDICTISGGDTICERSQINYPKTDPVFYVRNHEGSLLRGFDFGGCFSDHLFDGEDYELKVNLPAQYFDAPKKIGTTRKLLFVLITHTRGYYDYYRSRVVAEYGYDIPLVDPIRIYNNVDGGLGLVSAYSASVDSLIF